MRSKNHASLSLSFSYTHRGSKEVQSSVNVSPKLHTSEVVELVYRRSVQSL